MPVPRYDWKSSESVFSIFKTILQNEHNMQLVEKDKVYYLGEKTEKNKQISLSQLQEEIKTTKSAITQKLLALLSIGVIEKKRYHQEQFYFVNHARLQQIIGLKNPKYPIYDDAETSQNFEELIAKFGEEQATVELSKQSFDTLIKIISEKGSANERKEAKTIAEGVIIRELL